MFPLYRLATLAPHEECNVLERKVANTSPKLGKPHIVELRPGPPSRLALENEHNANPFVKENTKRLQAVSNYFHDREKMLLSCLLAIVLLPTDWLLRRLDKLDSVSVNLSSRASGSTPLIFMLLCPERSPVLRALSAITDLLKFGGHLGFMIYLWWKHEGSNRRWWRMNAMRGFRRHSVR